jgi:hypothetical protein
MSQDAAKKLTSIGITLMIIFACIQPIWKTNSLRAEETQNMRVLLENLKQKLSQKGDFGVTIQFAIPLIDNKDDKWWSFPYPADNPDMQRTIGEIGDDYVCFDELAGEAFTTRCTPFSNLVTVGYGK